MNEQTHASRMDVGGSESHSSWLHSLLSRFGETPTARLSPIASLRSGKECDLIEPLRSDVDPIYESFRKGAEEVMSALAGAFERWRQTQAGGPSGDYSTFLASFRDQYFNDSDIAHEPQRHAHRYRALLESIPLPTAVCKDDGALLTTNLLMDELLAANDGIFSSAGKVKCAVASESDLLTDLLRRAAQAGCRTARCCKISITRESGAAPLVLLISPMESAADGKDSCSEILVRVVIPERRRVIDAKELGEMFHLTRSEATLCTALIRTGNLERASGLCGLTTGSARQYLKRVFTKTGTSGQVELVSLILQLPVL